MLRKCCFLICLFQLAFWPAFIQASELQQVLPLRERGKIQDRWLASRFESIVPEIMRREQIDLWVLIAREYNDDPVLSTMLPASWFGARRRTVLMFFDQGAELGVERTAVSRYDVGTFFKSIWSQEEEPSQWACLAKAIEERDPAKIAINRSEIFSHADGLSSSEYEGFLQALPMKYRNRIVSGERLGVGWLETRIEGEIQAYPGICRIAHDIIAQGFSEKTILPGVTTTADLEWWYRDRVSQLDLAVWFHPSVSIQRATDPVDDSPPASGSEPRTIMPGDLIHVDFGLVYLGLHTDTQQHAYVLRLGEKSPPEGLQRALNQANRLQDILLSQFATGRTGNEILSKSLAQAASEEIEASIYTHPLGFHGHAAGPTIGLWDQQGGVPGDGDYPVFPNTAYSIELNVASKIDEWEGRTIRIMLEEDAYFDGRSIQFLDGRQTILHLVPRP